MAVMPTFIPPTTEGNQVGRPDDAGWTLWRYYGAWETGKTVWKDSEGVWHDSLNPFHGGTVTTTHDGDTTTVTDPVEGLSTAQVVYLGGHVYEITEDEAAELTAAGYGDQIT